MLEDVMKPEVHDVTDSKPDIAIRLERAREAARATLNKAIWQAVSEAVKSKAKSSWSGSSYSYEYEDVPVSAAIDRYGKLSELAGARERSAHMQVTHSGEYRHWPAQCPMCRIDAEIETALREEQTT
jgi:hypothetical protein